MAVEGKPRRGYNAPVSEPATTLPSELSADNDNPPTLPGILAVTWGTLGFVLLIGFALWRLTPLAVESFDYPWRWHHVAAFVANLIFMAWSEGYRGFQQAYSPRLGARCAALLTQASWLQALLAPAVVMGFMHAPRRRVITTWVLTFAVIGVVLLYRALPQPWRGILDAGVVLGLAWGLVATLAHVVMAIRRGPSVDAELTGS